MKTQLKDDIRSLLEVPLKQEGAVIADMVLSQYKSNSTLRLFIYSDNGTNLEECARISRLVGDIIDGTDYFERGYTLEVSSPGLDRPLTTLQDFKYRIGETVRLEFHDKRKKVTAEIVGTDEAMDTVLLKNETGDISVEMAEIERGKIIF